MVRSILLVQLAATLLMTGLIWFVQLVHYPLFARVGAQQFATYEAEHQRRTTWVVAPLMLAELATALLTVAPRLRPPAASATGSWAGLALVIAIWLSTALIQVPLHTQLASGYSAAAAARLVSGNWLRTLAWTARSALVLLWVARSLR